MPDPNRGEIWLVDLGYAAKVRPCVVRSIQAADECNRRAVDPDVRPEAVSAFLGANQLHHD